MTSWYQPRCKRLSDIRFDIDHDSYYSVISYCRSGFQNNTNYSAIILYSEAKTTRKCIWRQFQEEKKKCLNIVRIYTIIFVRFPSYFFLISLGGVCLSALYYCIEYDARRANDEKRVSWYQSNCSVVTGMIIYFGMWIFGDVHNVTVLLNTVRMTSYSFSLYGPRVEILLISGHRRRAIVVKVSVQRAISKRQVLIEFFKMKYYKKSKI